MPRDPNWLPPVLVHQTQLELPFPPRPGVKTRRMLADACPKCRCLHTSVESAQACRSMVNSREQQ